MHSKRKKSKAKARARKKKAGKPAKETKVWIHGKGRNKVITVR